MKEKPFFMANQTISYIQEDSLVDECSENIPPELSGEDDTSKVKVLAKNKALHSSLQLCEDTRPVCDTAFSSPTSERGGVEAKSCFRSALTPDLNGLNINNECSSSQLLKSDFHHMNLSRVNDQKSTRESGSLFHEMDAPVSLIEDESLPEITFHDLTYFDLTTNNSVLPQNSPAVSKLDEMKRVQTSAGEEDDPLDLLPPVNITVSTDLDGKMDSWFKSKSAAAAAGIFDIEITLLDASSNSEPSPVGQMTFMDTTRDCLPVDHLKPSITLSKLNGQIVSEPDISSAVPTEGSVNSANCETTRTGTSLDVTMIGILDKSNSSETSGQKMEVSQIPDKDNVYTRPANITLNISSSNDTSAKGAHLSTSGVKCNTSLTRVPSEVYSDSAENPNPLKTECEEMQTSCDIKSTSEVSQQSQTWTASENVTFSILPSSHTSAASDLSSTSSVSCPEHKTFDFSADNSFKAESVAGDQTKSIITKTSERQSSHSKVQNATFDRNSSQKSCNGSAADLSIQNNTFDCKAPSPKNDTVTLSEISSSDSRHNSLDKPLSPKISNVDASPEDEEYSELPKSNDKKAEHNGTTEANSALESTPEYEFKDLPQLRLPMSDGHFSALKNQRMVNNRANTFNLDETLDLGTNFFTSTPMPSCKMLTFDKEQKADTNLAVQKKLYQDDPNKAFDKLPENNPTNVVSDRKTFIQSNPRGLRPPSKTAYQMLNVQGSTVPERLEKVTTGQSIKKPKIQTACSKTTAVEEQQGTSGTSSSYGLGCLAAASKLPTSGFQRPQQSGIGLSIQRPALVLRPLLARSSRLSSSSTSNPPEPTATNPATKSSQGKKHPLTREEVLPALKKKKTEDFLKLLLCQRPLVDWSRSCSLHAAGSDAAAPSSLIKDASSCDATNKVKTLKWPTASLKSTPLQIHSNGAAGPAGSAETSTSCDALSRVRALRTPRGSLRAPLTRFSKRSIRVCARCGVLQEELKQKSDEIQKLKQELQKYQKQEDN